MFERPHRFDYFDLVVKQGIQVRNVILEVGLVIQWFRRLEEIVFISDFGQYIVIFGSLFPLKSRI